MANSSVVELGTCLFVKFLFNALFKDTQTTAIFKANAPLFRSNGVTGCCDRTEIPILIDLRSNFLGWLSCKYSLRKNKKRTVHIQ